MKADIRLNAMADTEFPDQLPQTAWKVFLN